MAKEKTPALTQEQRQVLKETGQKLDALKDTLPNLKRAGVNTNALNEQISNLQKAKAKLEQM